MAESMIERVARAIATAEFGAMGEMEEYHWQKHRELFLTQALAAIEAMREPTKEMIEAGYGAIEDAVDFYNYDSDHGVTVEPFGGAMVLRAMIDAALKEKP